MRILIYSVLAAAAVLVIACGVASSSSTASVPVTVPVAGPSAGSTGKTEVAVFAGGCFWGVEAVFEHVKGVTDARSGYAGGDAKTADYDTVSEGATGHAESVQVTFDPAVVSYEQLLQVFFMVAHDPTELNRQGPDTGTQYRSAIFYVSDQQQRTAREFIRKLGEAKAYPKPIVTEITPLEKFYEAEAYHQDYLVKNPNQPYIVRFDKPKLVDLEKRFPQLTVLSIAPLIARAIREVFDDGSVTSLFDGNS